MSYKAIAVISWDTWDILLYHTSLNFVTHLNALSYQLYILVILSNCIAIAYLELNLQRNTENVTRIMCDCWSLQKYTRTKFVKHFSGKLHTVIENLKLIYLVIETRALMPQNRYKHLKLQWLICIKCSNLTALELGYCHVCGECKIIVDIDKEN